MSHAIIPGYERFRRDQLSDVDAGRLLISELNCQACHGPLLSASLPARKAPVLTDAASRLTPRFIKEFLNNPQAVKAGTAMPDVLGGDDAERQVEALTHFLASSGSLVPSPVSAVAVKRGEALFHRVGCAACHGDQRKSASERPEFAMPLGDPNTKYTVGSLAAFLKNPHVVRPSGRMPALNLTDEEARDIASYLMKDVKVDATITFEMFEGRWNELPDFEMLTAKVSGETADFDVLVTEKRERFALRFRTFLHVPQDGDYQIWLGSDDGSRLLIDGEQVVVADGVHPHTIVEGKVTLTAGPHPLVVEYFEDGGEESLSVEIAGPNLARQPLAGFVSKSKDAPGNRDAFVPDSELVAAGRRLFDTAGCASCHQHDGIKDVVRLPKSIPPFAKLDLGKGCLSPNAADGIPQFALTEAQRSDIAAAIRSLTAAPQAEASPSQQISTTMLTLNCYACHQRGEVGGVPRIQDHLFTGSIPEMGDEGRIPPHLDGIGDKLQTSWLKHVMQQGAKDRPYMATRMPKFGEQNVGSLPQWFADVDAKSDVPDVTFDEPVHRVIADARLMVGDQALSCIKCHTFDKYKATGLQSLDLTTMSRRLRRDWFHRYLLNPQSYRPGTRMPSAWPNNRSVVPKILDGDPARQLEAIWLYLQDGSQAKIPSGLIAEAIELKPTERPIIYRNFIEGLSARGIAVGFPEGAHYAWDAEQMNLRLIWHGAFIDASKHWVGRGPGNQSPAGDHVMTLVSGQPLAVLQSTDQPWPTESSRNAGFEFLGYRLNKAGEPAFRYSWREWSVVDRIVPVIAESRQEPSLNRSLEFSVAEPKTTSGKAVSFRIAAAKTIQAKDDGWLINGAVFLKFRDGQAELRTVEGGHELLVKLIPDSNGRASIAYEMTW
ncbi:MAG: c-type cytochrome [Planctomycetaceae bacterium]